MLSRADYLQVLPSARTEKPPVVVDATLCPTCKSPLSERHHGWVKDYSLHSNHEGHFLKFGYCLVPCPSCAGSVEQKQEAQRKAQILAHLFGASQIPYYAKKWTFESFPSHGDQLSRKRVQAFVTGFLQTDEDMKRGLWLGGAPGRGKTGLAICALKEAMAHERSTLFVSTIELMNKLRASLHTGEQDELLRSVTETDLVVLDDVATERPTAYVLEQFYYIVEKRRARGLWTIFTSNLNTADLADYWRPEDVQPDAFYSGLRVVERIRDYCLGIVVAGPNQRGGGR